MEIFHGWAHRRNVQTSISNVRSAKFLFMQSNGSSGFMDAQVHKESSPMMTAEDSRCVLNLDSILGEV
jgi:hypothetical protein